MNGGRGMAGKSMEDLGSLQRAIMEAVWDLREATVHQVQDRLAKEKELAYTTVLSAMQKLEKMGWLAHRPSGRNYVYLATRSRDEQSASSLRKFIDHIFGGNPMAAFQNLLEDERLTDDELTRLKDLIEKRRKESHHD
jgi:predicted transcriptional regulator